MNELKPFTNVSFDAMPEVFKRIQYWKGHRKQTDDIYKLLTYLGMTMGKDMFNDTVDKAAIRYVEEFRKGKLNPIDFIKPILAKRQENKVTVRVEEHGIRDNVNALESYILTSLNSRHSMEFDLMSSVTLYIIDNLYKHIELYLCNSSISRDVSRSEYAVSSEDFYNYSSNDEFHDILEMQVILNNHNFTSLVNLLADNDEQKRLASLLRKIVKHNNYATIVNLGSGESGELYRAIISNVSKYDEYTKLELVGYVHNNILQSKYFSVSRIEYIASKRHELIRNLRK